MLSVLTRSVYFNALDLLVIAVPGLHRAAGLELIICCSLEQVCYGSTCMLHLSSYMP